MPSRKGSFPELDRFILLSAGTHFLCPWFFVRLDEAGFRMRPMEPRGRGTGIFLVEEKREPRDEKRPRRRGAEATTPEPTD